MRIGRQQNRRATQRSEMAGLHPEAAVDMAYHHIRVLFGREFRHQLSDVKLPIGRRVRQPAFSDLLVQEPWAAVDLLVAQ